MVDICGFGQCEARVIREHALILEESSLPGSLDQLTYAL